MYQVSEAYREQMEKPLRNMSYINILYSVTEPDALGAAVLTDDGHMPYSGVAEIAAEKPVEHIYKTLEDNHFLLDGKNILLPDNTADCDYQGYCGDDLSDESGSWRKPPEIRVTFGENRFRFAGLAMQFDLDPEEFPQEIRVIARNNGAAILDRSVQVTPDQYVEAVGTTYYVFREHIPETNDIEIQFVRSGKPYRRPRLLSLVFGVMERFGVTDLTSCKQTAETDVISSKLPRGDFDFTVFDTKQTYDPENPSGSWEYLESRQPVKFFAGYELDGGAIEWVPCGQTYTTGDVDIGRTGIITEVTFKSTALIQQLDKTYDEGSYYPEGRTLYELAQDVMTFAGYPKMLQLDPALRSVVSKVPLPELPVNQCLQLIANASRCIMQNTRDGMIAIVRPSATAEEFHMDFSKVTETPKTTRYPQLKTLNTSYKNVSVESQSTDLVSNAEVEDADSTEVELKHDAAAQLSVQLSSGLTLVAERHYARKSVLTLTGTGTVTVKGKKLTVNDVKYSKTCNIVGEDLDVANELISNLKDAELYADWIADAMARRNEYTAPDRGYPELDVGDEVVFMSNSSNTVPAMVLKRELSFNGAISGSGKYLIGGDQQ